MIDTTQTPLEGVFFDLDGTLLDTALDFETALNKLLFEEARDPLAPEDFRANITNGSVGIIRSVFDLETSNDAFLPLQQRLLSHYKACLTERTCVFPGLETSLELLREFAITWGVVTNKPSEYAIPIVDSITPDCATLVCPDHVKNSKPDPEGLFLACENTGVNPNQCIYIGDHQRDIEAGQAAGMKTIAVGWGYIEAGDSHLDWNADLFVEKPEQLITAITSFLK